MLDRAGMLHAAAAGSRPQQLLKVHIGHILSPLFHLVFLMISLYNHQAEIRKQCAKIGVLQ